MMAYVICCCCTHMCNLQLWGLRLELGGHAIFFVCRVLVHVFFSWFIVSRIQPEHPKENIYLCLCVSLGALMY